MSPKHVQSPSQICKGSNKVFTFNPTDLTSMLEDTKTNAMSNIAMKKGSFIDDQNDYS